MSDPKPLNEFTVDEMADHLRSLAPAAEVAVDGHTVTLRLVGFDNYIRVEGHAIYGPGLGWGADTMGPSNWGEGLPDDVVTSWSLTRIDEVRQVVDHLANLLYSLRPEPAPNDHT